MSESTALATTEQTYGGLTMVVSPAEALKRLQQLQAFVAEVMVVDVDYGKIPGTDKDTLLQPGAQKLCEIYGFAQSFVDSRAIEDWDKPLFHYEMKCVLTSRRDGSFIGDGIGSCNSKEKRYAGRWAFDNEIPAGIAKNTLKKREGKSKKPPHRPYVQYFIPNDDIFSLVNTMKKMACKRALVMAVIGATRSSGLFTQDVEDIPAEAFGKPAPDPEEPAKPTEEEKQKTHHELRVMLTSAKTVADLPIVLGLMRTAWGAKRLTKAHWDDLIAYGNKRRGELGGSPPSDRPPPPNDDARDEEVSDVG